MQKRHLQENVGYNNNLVYCFLVDFFSRLVEFFGSLFDFRYGFYEKNFEIMFD